MRYALIILGLIVMLAALGGIKATQISSLIAAGKAMQEAGPPPESVSVATAEQRVWETTLHAIGSVVSVKGVALSNDAPGVVSRIAFDSGAEVKKGQILVELDSKVERAQLSSLRARRWLAERSRERTKSLVQTGSLAQAELDTAESTLNGLNADVAALEAQIERKIVRAPFAGKLGIRAINLGQYLAPGTTLTVLESNQPTSVDFTLPQKEIDRVRPGLPIRVFAESNPTPIAEGTLETVEPALEAVTRSLKLRARVPHDEGKLRPGMFVNIQVVLPEQNTRVIVPQTAVIHAAYGDSIFSVEPDPKDGKRMLARQHFVRLGEERGDFVAILEGLNAGQRVVSSGAFKLRNGARVVLSDQAQTKPELDPRPQNR
ncbi:MAG TPA: efflux RND transporter periplasmic adaptor subunit [Polyangiaceae bacterium]|nr:efflux RND transporter periplasmic adaptor subunit [Polyangiaceae bacterium]